MTPAPPSGILLVDKPEGPTSMAVCRKVRWLLTQGGAPKRIKVGHGGTLDPLATGLLVVMVGKATTLCNRVMQGHKRYTAHIDLSSTSITDDREGPITTLHVSTPPTHADLHAACARFVGLIQQTPPLYSAIKVGGTRACDRARQGQAPELKPRTVEIHSISIADYRWPIAVLEVHCGKGVYIRSLARDLGQSLGVGGMLTALRRTQVGPFHIDAARPLASLPCTLTQDHLLPIQDLEAP